MPGSGKDEFISVASSMGFKDFHMGNTVRTYARNNGIPSTDQEIGKFATSERQTNGMDIWAKRTSVEIGDASFVVIDGIRNIEEVEFFKKNYLNFRIVAVFANREDRYQRIMVRHRPDDVRTRDELIRRDERELSWGIAKVIALADFMVVNDSSLDEFYSRAGTLLKRLKSLRDP
jgi:dephospho-CoA kinase